MTRQILQVSALKGQVKTGRAIDLFIRGVDTEQVLDDAAAILLNRIRTRFQQQIDPEGHPWIQSQAAIDENRNTLIDTGKLFRSIQLYQTSKGMRLIGTDVEYAPYHHAPRKGIRRAFMAFNDEDLSLIEAMILLRFS